MMALTGFLRRILGPGRFPQLEGQELPDPVAVGQASTVANPADRIKAQGRVVKIRVKPQKPLVP